MLRQNESALNRAAAKLAKLNWWHQTQIVATKSESQFKTRNTKRKKDIKLQKQKL